MLIDEHNTDDIMLPISQFFHSKIFSALNILSTCRFSIDIIQDDSIIGFIQLVSIVVNTALPNPPIYLK